MPRATQLPDDLQPLTRRNALELSDTHFHRDVDGLIETLDRVLGMPRSPSSQAGTSGTATPPSASTRTAPLEPALVVSLNRSFFRRWLRVGGIACLIIGIFFFLWHVEEFPDYFVGRQVRSPIFLGLGIVLLILNAIIGRKGRS